MSAPALPYPPLDLANRVGSLEGAEDPLSYYDELGRRIHDAIVSQLPADWSFAGKRVLDFGCGAGRTLRHFVDETDGAEFWGCDIDEASVAWMTDHICPPFHVFANRPEPPLEVADPGFDLIYAVSVFTHLTDEWSGWLASLHSQLRPQGLLLATFMGSGMVKMIASEEWDDRSTGMNVLRYGQSWELGGPMVLHSPWWIEEHWGRAFEILSLRPDGFASEPGTGQGSVLMRRRETLTTAELLEEVDPRDERELRALAHNLAQVQAECGQLRQDRDYLLTVREEGVARARDLEARMAELANTLAVVENSRSMRLTQPLRALAARARSLAR